MPSHPRVEEVEDSDVDVSDPSEDDIDDFDDSQIMRRVDPGKPAAAPSAVSSSSSGAPQPLPFRPAAAPSAGGPAIRTTTDASAYKNFQCLYSVYFDAARSRAEGRRVSRALAVANPLASEIANACGQLQLQTVFEPAKLHPKDWGNPGRVRVLLDPKHKNSTADGLSFAASARGPAPVKNKHHLYVLVARHLQAHPTTEDGAALRFHARGGPPPPADGAEWPKPAVPRGWKINRLVPFHSPAMTGGGVSENLFKDMMSQMGPGMVPPGMEGLMGAAAGPSKQVEDKKEKKAKRGKGKS